MVVATADYETKKSDHLVFYKGEKIRVYERYITQPYGKFWVGEVVDVEVCGFLPRLFTINLLSLGQIVIVLWNHR